MGYLDDGVQDDTLRIQDSPPFACTKDGAPKRPRFGAFSSVARLFHAATGRCSDIRKAALRLERPFTEQSLRFGGFPTCEMAYFAI